jgi:sugar porter (SP) family MFS transporter
MPQSDLNMPNHETAFRQLEGTTATTDGKKPGNALVEPAFNGPRSSYTYKIAVTAAASGFLFGFDTAVINGALLFLRSDFRLSDLETEIAVGSLLVGCLLGSAAAGALSDWFGRKRLLLAAGALFGLSSLGTALPRNLHEFVMARLLAGLAIGVASVVAPMYVAESSPAHIRGRLVSLNQVAIATGVLCAFLTNWALSGLGKSSWRFMFAVAALPSFALVLSLLFVPESPRWLIRVGRLEMAIRVLRRVSGPQAEAEAEEIRQSLSEESGTIREMLAPHLRRPLLIAITLAVLSQVTGINTVIYYGAVLFSEHTGKSNASAAIAVNVIVGIVALFAALLATVVIDKVGRKFLLLAGSAGMIVSLGILGALLRVSPPPTNMILTVVLFYVGFFGIGLAPVTWVYIAELFPTAIRGRAVSLATLSLWAGCLAVSLSFLTLMRLLSPAGIFWVYAAWSAVTFVFVWRLVPETKGRSLEEIQSMWGSDGGLKDGSSPAPGQGRRLRGSRSRPEHIMNCP